jgi:hypothetical protein
MVAPSVRFVLCLAVWLGAAISTGCVVVHAHEREHLAKRAMTNDLEPGELRFGQHARGAREGADGGTGQPGGGCGCN